MPKFTIKDELYIILLKFFDNSVDNLKKSVINDLKKDIYKGEIIDEIDKDLIKTLTKLLKLKEQKYDDYVKLSFVYPDWKDDEEIIYKKLKEAFQEIYHH